MLTKRSSLHSLVLVLALLCVVASPAGACTIFVLTDSSRALFCNNEDWSNPNTRIWFVPGGKGRYGVAYVGFDNNWAQGGMNEKGLAFDWVAGYKETWAPKPGAKHVRGNPSERMLERCANIDEAIAFYRTYFEPSFGYAKMLIADNTGASVIVGARDGELQVERANQSHGFGYGEGTLARMLSTATEPTVANGLNILHACTQRGPYSTKYSNIFDLKSGDIILVPDPEKEDTVRLNLAAELAKGRHSYDIPGIRGQGRDRQ